MARKENKKITSRKNRPKRKARPTFAIVVEGKTEFWYFQKLKENEKQLAVNIMPTIPERKKLSELFEIVKQKANEIVHDKVFWIIDLDKIIQDGKVEELKRFLFELESKEYNNVITIFNNPCLEFWFLLHFKQTTRYYRRCQKTIDELKKYLTGYSKSEKYYLKEDNDIYRRLKPNLERALDNTRHTQRTNLNDLQRAICEMNLFFKTDEIWKVIYGNKSN